jgi:hypothetical protein
MRKLLALTLLSLLTAAPAAAATPWYSQKEDIACDGATGSSPFYNGDSASARYDRTFHGGPELPAAFLDGYVPQGLATLPGGQLLQSGYNAGAHKAAVIGLNPTSAIAQILRPDGSALDAHVGGVAVVGDKVFIAGVNVGGYPTLLRFGVKKVARALSTGQPLKAGAELPIKVKGFSASFLSAEGNAIWAGMFDSGHRNRMYRLNVGPKGNFKVAKGWVQVPKKTQGLAVTPTHFLFSTSYGSKNRSNIYVVRRGQKLLDAAYPQDLVCFAGPSMSEGLAVNGANVFLTFESGSFAYRGDPCDKPVLEGDCTRNIISHLHVAPVASLTALT